MTTTTVPSGQTANGVDVTNGNTLDVSSGATATSTTVENGGSETVEAGGTDTAATILTGGTQTLLGTASNDVVAGTINVTGATAVLNNATVNNGGAVNLSTAGAAANGVTVNNGGSLNLTIKGATATNTTVNQGGLLFINGNAQANGVTLHGGTLELNSPKADTSATGNVTFAAGINSRIQFDVAQPTVAAFSPAIVGFAPGDVVDEQGLNFVGSSFTTTTSGTTTTLTVTGGNNTGSQSFAFQNVAAGSLAVISDINTATGVTSGLEIVVCFAAGTRITTVDGDVAVEALSIGDLVVTASGAHRPIRWIGHRTVDCRRHPRPLEAIPVRVAAHAFGADRPARDLVVSPGHSLCVDVLGEVLIPAGALVNGSTITRDDVDRVTYWHVALDSHDIVLAENMPAESYLETGNLGFFAEADTTALHATPDAAATTDAAFCRPVHRDGPVVAFVRERLAARVPTLGWSLEHLAMANLHLVVDGRRLEAEAHGLSARFLVPAGADEVWLVSDTAVPAEIGMAADTRRLGVCVGALVVDDGFGAPRTIAADDPALCLGFHENEGAQRWTCGRARLPASLWETCRGSFFLRVDLSRPALPRWVASSASPRAADLVLLAG